MSRPVAPPSGWPAPTTATLAGRPISLVPLAEAIADRYFDEFPEDLSRYGVAARQWEIHDTLHCLNWAMLDVEQVASLEREIAFSITAAFEDAELGVFVLADHVVPRLELARRCRELGCPLLVLGLGPRMDFERSRELMRGELVPEDFLSDLGSGELGRRLGELSFIVFVFTRSSAQTSSAVTAWTAASFPAALLIAIVIAFKAPPDPEQKATVVALSIERRDAHGR